MKAPLYLLVIVTTGFVFAGRLSADERIVNGGFEAGDFSGWTTNPAASGSHFG